MMRERRIFLLNLNSLDQIPPQDADAIGGLVINEFLATARGLEPEERQPTFLLLDEFQRFVGRDLEEALPEVRQLKMRLILAHQSLTQLQRGDIDLTMLIFQAQSRLVFGMQGPEVATIAEEFASINFDPYRIKDEIYALRQKKVGDEIIELASWGDCQGDAQNWTRTVGSSWSAQDSRAHLEGVSGRDHLGSSAGRSGSQAAGEGGGTTRTRSHTVTQHLRAVMQDFEELVQRSYFNFEDDKQIWASKIRKLKRGQSFLRLVDVDKLYRMAVEKSAPGHLSWEPEEVRHFLPQAQEALQKMLEANYSSEYFSSPEAIDREREQRLQAILRPPLTLHSEAPNEASGTEKAPGPAPAKKREFL
jgi:hypothetical protein